MEPPFTRRAAPPSPESPRQARARQAQSFTPTVHQLVGLLLAATGSMNAWSEEASGSATKAPALNEVTLPLVTVTAGENAQGTASEGYREERVSNVGPWQGRTLQETPYAITVFSEELMSNLQAVSADQVFRINPTMQLSRSQYENNQPTVFVRGFSFYAPYRDGVPDDQYAHASTMEDTERIEVLNGLSGFLYGAGNVGGMVNYVTKRSPNERLNDITVAGRGHQSWYVHGDFGGKFDADKKYGYRLNVAKQGGDTAIKGQTIDRNFYSLVLDGKPRSDLYLHFSAARNEYEDWGVQSNWAANASTRPSANALRTDRSYSPSWTHRYYETNRYTAHAKWDVNQSVSLRANVLFSDGVRNGASSPTNNSFTSPSQYSQSFSYYYAPGVNNVLSYQDDKRGALYADFKFDTGQVNHKVTAGFQYGNTHQDRWSKGAPPVRGGSFSINDPQYVSPPVIDPISRGSRNTWLSNIKRNVMVGDDITVNDQWSVLAGMAYTNITNRTYDKSAVTPTVALVFKPMPPLSTYGSYMESLEQGGLAADEYQGVTVLNKGTVFKPLKSKQIEVGAKYDWNGMLLSGALFQIDKALQYYDLRDSRGPVFVQDGRQVHKGIELTAIGRLRPGLSVLGGLTWMDPKVKQQRQDPRLEGKRPPQVADKMLKVHAEYAVPLVTGLSVSGGFNSTSASFADNVNTDRLPGYTVYDIGLRYQMGPVKKPLILRMDLLNVTDKHYWANNAALGDPRTLLISANYRF